MIIVKTDLEAIPTTCGFCKYCFADFYTGFRRCPLVKNDRLGRIIKTEEFMCKRPAWCPLCETGSDEFGLLESDSIENC